MLEKMNNVERQDLVGFGQPTCLVRSSLSMFCVVSMSFPSMVPTVDANGVLRGVNFYV